MTTALRAVWLSAESNFQGSLPEARCGHVAASIKNHAAWGDEFIIIHGEWRVLVCSETGTVDTGHAMGR